MKNLVVLYSRDYPHSKGFRGFKRIDLSTYHNAPAIKGIHALMRSNPKSDPFNVDHRTIRLKVVQDNRTFTTPKLYLDIFVDGNMIGTLYSDYGNFVDTIMSNMVDKVHVRIEDGGDRFISYLFIHTKDEVNK